MCVSAEKLAQNLQSSILRSGNSNKPRELRFRVGRIISLSLTLINRSVRTTYRILVAGNAFMRADLNGMTLALRVMRCTRSGISEAARAAL